MPDLSLPQEPLLAARADSRVRAGTALARALPAVLSFVLVGGLAAAEGGYFPMSWGWTAMAVSWVAAVALVLRPRLVFGGAERALVVSLLGLAGWIALSALWSASVPRTALEVERTLVYVAAALALLALTRRDSGSKLLGGALAGATLAAAYGLATRLLPERFANAPDSIGGYRLSEPIGYWNALGVFTAIGAVLALGFVARGRATAVRALAAASLAVLLPTLYFTFSRGGWLALLMGGLAALALDPRRLQLLTAMLAVLPAPALAVWLGSRSGALTRLTGVSGEGSSDGHRLALAILLLAALAAAGAVVLAVAERRLTIPRRVRRGYGGAALVACAVLAAAAFVRLGSPAQLYDAFTAPPPATRTSLNERLFNLSGSGRNLQWSVAWDAYAERPWLGSGAGTYELDWLARREVAGKVRDAHNLYLETLAELGPAGLALLLGLLAVPLRAAVAARREPLVPIAFGAFVAFALHAGVDWDWEMPAITVAGLVAACAIVIAQRPADERVERRAGRFRAAAAVLALAVGTVAFVGLLGNRALADSRAAALAGQWQRSANRARDAARFAPWDAEPWRRVALAQPTAARARPYFLKAIAKDRRNWELWLELAWASSGADRQRALAEASRLNPLSPEIAEYRARLAAERKAVPPS